jgi:hypothetical protein
MDARQFIDLIGAGQSAEAKDALEELLSQTAFGALEAKKQEIATTLFNGKVEEPENTEVSTEEPQNAE